MSDPEVKSHRDELRRLLKNIPTFGLMYCAAYPLLPFFIYCVILEEKDDQVKLLLNGLRKPWYPIKYLKVNVYY